MLTMLFIGGTIAGDVDTFGPDERHQGGLPLVKQRAVRTDDGDHQPGEAQ